MMTKTILVLAANPKNTPPLRLDQEVREIDNGLERAQKRDEFTLKQKLAARPVDVRRAMLDYKPNIVHFCGHGSGEEGIAFEDENGQANLISADALAGFFELFADKVECVVLNACYSEVQAEAIAQHISYVIGMKKAIGDSAAIEFAVAFYDAIGAGKSVEFAYKLACNAMAWVNQPERTTPVLKIRAENQQGIRVKQIPEEQIRLVSNDMKPQWESSAPAESSALIELEGIFAFLVAPFPMEILTKLIATSTELPRRLDDLIASQVLSKDSDTIFRGLEFNMPLAASYNVPETFIERTLTELLLFIHRRNREKAGVRQCENALALFKSLSAQAKWLLAPRFFDVLDRPMKALGNKQLVEQVAKLCVEVSDHPDRTKEEAECEARARICGLSWVYQRTGRLDLAADEAEKSFNLSDSLHLQKNLAFCNKCRGRLWRMRAEDPSHLELRNVHLKKSIECLEEAIKKFSSLPEYGNEDPEVGDCYSLLARTYLVAGDLAEAEQCSGKAVRRITDTISKDYLDLQILLGDLAERRGRRDEAIVYYTTVVDSPSDDADFPRSEIVARALTQRAECFSSIAPEKAIKDFLTAKTIFAHYQEEELSAKAEWQAILLSEKFPLSVKKILEKELVIDRVEAVRRYEQKKSAKKTGTLSQRVGHDDIVWKQLLKQVREDRALNREKKQSDGKMA